MRAIVSAYKVSALTSFEQPLIDRSLPKVDFFEFVRYCSQVSLIKFSECPYK